MYLAFISIIFLFTLLLWFAVANGHKVRDMGLAKTGAVMLAAQKAKVQVATHSVDLAAGHAIEGIADKQQIEIIRRLVDDIRFEEDQSGYSIVDENTVNVVLPPGKDPGGLRDANDRLGVEGTIRRHRGNTKKIEQASQGLQEVNENVSQSSVVAGSMARDIVEVNKVSNQISTSSEHTKNSAGELLAVALELSKLVGVFRI